MDTVASPAGSSPDMAGAEGMPADLPADENWGHDGWGNDMDLNSLQHQHMTAVTSLSASQATSAAWHADIAAKQAASLAQWVQYLWGQVSSLQKKVTELEDWKKHTLEEMTKLRFEHKTLRRKVLPDGEADSAPLVPKAKSLPLLLAEHVESGENQSPSALPVAQRKAVKAQTENARRLGPPPGLEEPWEKEEAVGGKQVSFGTITMQSPVNNLNSSFDASPQAAESAFDGSTTTPTAQDDGNLEGVQVELTMLDGRDCMCAEWRIGHLSVKLRNCMGRALVSPPFKVWGLEDLRLMVFADGTDDVAKGPRSKRQKDQYAKKVTEGPLDGCLKLKVPDCPPPHLLEYYLKIGNVRKGPFSHNFSESTVNGCPGFSIDWLKQVETDQSLKVTVEIFATQACRRDAE